MSPSEWNRVPGPWRLIHAIAAGAVVGACIGAAVLAILR